MRQYTKRYKNQRIQSICKERKRSNKKFSGDNHKAITHLLFHSNVGRRKAGHRDCACCACWNKRSLCNARESNTPEEKIAEGIIEIGKKCKDHQSINFFFI